MTGPLPVPTADLDQARRDMDDHGFCLVEDALGTEQLAAIRRRLFEQLEAERQCGHTRRLPDGKQLVVFLLNKGQVFRDMILHAGLHAVVRHVLGEEYLLSSYHAHFRAPRQQDGVPHGPVLDAAAHGREQADLVEAGLDHTCGQPRPPCRRRARDAS